MRHYKDIIDRAIFEDTYKISLDEFNLYSKRNSIRALPTKCDNCGDIFWINKTVFKKRLCYTEYYEKCFGDTWFCMKDECTSVKKSLVCVDRMLQNQDSIEKRLAASKNRRGKTYEEQYGEEEAKRVKAVIKQKRKGQPEPMLGKHHSDKAKLKMSLSKQELINSHRYFNYTMKFSSKGSLLRWFDNKQLLYQSSYEKRYIELLNSNRLYFDRCEFTIPYVLDGINRLYIPDFLIYKDFTCISIDSIIEVKPKYALGYKQVVLKLKALEDFCRYNNYKMVVITEDQLNENKVY